jgi:uncharacterized protein YaaW (UPF0174 family)
LKDLRDASLKQKEKALDCINDNKSADMSQTITSNAASLDYAVSSINNKNSDQSFQFKSTESRIDQFLDIIIDKGIARYEVETNMMDSISTKDIDNIVSQCTSNIMETYIDEAEMTDLDESIRSDKSILSYSFETELDN